MKFKVGDKVRLTKKWKHLEETDPLHKKNSILTVSELNWMFDDEYDLYFKEDSRHVSRRLECFEVITDYFDSDKEFNRIEDLIRKKEKRTKRYERRKHRQSKVS